MSQDFDDDGRVTGHHIDKRAGELLLDGQGDESDLLDTSQLAEWLGLSVATLEIWRTKNLGPPWIKLSERRTRYRRADVLGWLEIRRHARTAYVQGRRRGSHIIDGRVIGPEQADDAA
jgi:predicted DNA-binding transcriptional regulator AlpA